MNLDFDKTIQVNARGLPACLRVNSSPALRCREEGLRRRDRRLRRGRSRGRFPEQQPFAATGPVVLFNGGVHGGTTLILIHAYVAVPAPTAVIATAKLTRIHRGRFGTPYRRADPGNRRRGRLGHRVQLTIGRNFTYRGKKQSYLTASCPTGHYYTEGEVGFADGTTLGITHVLPCTPTE